MTNLLWAVLITLTNGTVIVCPFQDQPKLELSEGRMVLTSTDKSGEWLFEDVDHWEFATTDGISTPTIATVPNSTVRVYNASGAVTATYKTDSDGRIQIDTDNLPKGVSIIALPGKTIKIAK